MFISGLISLVLNVSNHIMNHIDWLLQVSWVRQSDLAILASGGVSHTSDARISTSADETLSDWQLRIDAAQTKDSGIYECQVNTEPKINWPVTVHVEGTFHFVFPNYGSMLLKFNQNEIMAVMIQFFGFFGSQFTRFFDHICKLEVFVRFEVETFQTLAEGLSAQHGAG